MRKQMLRLTMVSKTLLTVFWTFLLVTFVACSVAFAQEISSTAENLGAYPVGVQTDPCAQAIPKGHQNNLDFGQMCKYEASNAKLPQATDHRVVFFGDSITEFWGGLPGLQDNDILNRGISGQTTAQMLVRFKADVIDLRPRVVHLMMGTNDIAGNTGATSLQRIQNAIASMAEQARANGIRVVLASIPPAKQMSWRKEIEPRPSIKAVNTWLSNYAAREGFVYVDYGSVLDDGTGGIKTPYSADGVHPTSTGYSVMTPLAKDAIRRAAL